MSKRRDNKENEWTTDDTQSHCKQHQGKKGKYRVINVPQGGKGRFSLCDYVCSKCAVNLVAQGYKVEETVMDIQQQRQEEIQQFLVQINNCFAVLDQTENALMEKKHDLLKFCDKQRNKVREYYHKIVMAIENRMSEQLLALNEAQQLMEDSYDNRHAEIKDCHNDLIQMYSDIEVNLENILMHVDQVPYKQVMTQYSRRIQSSLTQLGRFGTEQIPLIKVQLKKSQEMILGGLMEDSELEMKPVQTNLLKRKDNSANTTVIQDQSVSRVLMSPSTGIASCMTTATPKQEFLKQRSLSQPTYGHNSGGSGPQKYLDILQKVNENQLKTNDYYSTLLKGSGLGDSNHSQLMSVPVSRGSPVDPNKPYFSPKFK